MHCEQSHALGSHGLCHLEESSNVGTGLQGCVVLLGSTLARLVDALHDVLHKHTYFWSAHTDHTAQQDGISSTEAPLADRFAGLELSGTVIIRQHRAMLDMDYENAKYFAQLLQQH